MSSKFYSKIKQLINNRKFLKLNYNFNSFLNKLRTFLIFPFKQSDTTSEIDVPHVEEWQRTIFKNTVMSYTEYVIAELNAVENEIELLGKLEELLIHLKKFPEGIKIAIESGIISQLLKIQEKCKKPEVIGCIRECLTLFGYVGTLPKRGIRILSMDGGGTRGIFHLLMLERLEKLTGEKVHEMFDMVCGVSTGAILAFALGTLKLEIKVVYAMYRHLSSTIFQQSSIRGTSNLVWNQAYYDTNLWEKTLQDRVGPHRTLLSSSRDPACPRVCCIASIVNRPQLSPFVFRTYGLPYGVISQYTGSYNGLIWKAIRASAAAPGVFEEVILDDMILQDGAICLNNPVAIALHEAKLLWPDSELQCVASLGTGKINNVSQNFTQRKKQPQSTSWASKLQKIIDSATDVEAVHLIMEDLLPKNIYFRLNPVVSDLIALTETDNDKITKIEKECEEYMRVKSEKFEKLAQQLLKKKDLAQEFKDYLKMQRDTHGI